jgi:hypothetical protein
MSFLIYFVVLIITVGAALFGLDVVTAPLPDHKPAAPMTSAASGPNKLAKRQAEQAERDVAANRVLTPLYPANPGGVRDVTTEKPPFAETSGSAAAVDAPAPPQKSEVAATPAKPATAAAQPASAEHPAAQAVSQQAVQGVSQQVSGHCDIQACASAYRSFRASDCTYQPYDGPRRACVAPATQALNSSESPLQRASRQTTRASMMPATAPRYQQPPVDDEDDMDDADTPMDEDEGSIVIYQRPRWFR